MIAELNVLERILYCSTVTSVVTRARSQFRRQNLDKCFLPYHYFENPSHSYLMM